MLTKYKPQLTSVTTFLAKPFLKFDPNILSLLGLLPPIFFVIFFVNKNYILALLMFVGLLFDTIDGTVARLTNRVTPFGGFLDSSLDRVADFLILCGFGFAGVVSFELICIVAFLSFLISYLRSRAELAGKGEISLAVGVIERTERLAILVLAYLSIWIYPQVRVAQVYNLAEMFIFILGIFSVVTIIQRFVAAYNLLKKIK